MCCSRFTVYKFDRNKKSIILCLDIYVVFYIILSYRPITLCVHVGGKHQRGIWGNFLCLVFLVDFLMRVGSYSPIFFKARNTYETAMARPKNGRSQVELMIRMMIERSLAGNEAMTSLMGTTARRKNVIIRRNRSPLTTMTALVIKRYNFGLLLWVGQFVCCFERLMECCLSN